MGRHRTTPTTALGAAVQQRRGSLKLSEVATEIGVDKSCLSRVENGAGVRGGNAERLAGWLGWSVGDVVRAADVEIG